MAEPIPGGLDSSSVDSMRTAALLLSIAINAAAQRPDPAPLLYACRNFGIAPHEMLMIGDSLNDAEAARAAGCPMFCVPYGYNEGRDVRELDVDAIVATLVEAEKLIRLS